jgi:opacity protein-like surface antigen
MRNRIFLMILAGLALLSIPKSVLAQDNDKVLILSPRVGSVIDAGERERYGLFQGIKGFDRAVFFQTPEKKYYAKIMCVGSDGARRDTTVQYSEDELKMLAEQIDHFEDIQKGTYKMGQQPATLKVVERQGQVVKQEPDLLPFAAQAGEFETESYPDWGFGIGLSTYSPDFSGLNAAFASVEQKYRNQGYSVPLVTLGFHPSSCLWYNIKIRFSRSLGLLLEVGTANNGDTAHVLRAVSATGLYHFEAFKISWLRPYVGAGLGRYHFRVTQDYKNVSPGRDLVVFVEGGNIGFHAVAGVELSPRGEPSLSLYAKYLFIPTVETTTTTGVKANVDLSSMVAGATISFYF